jgi:hypothetical protein
MFEKEFEKFLKQQKAEASGQRLEMLQKDLSGTKKMLEVAIWPALKTFEGLTLEYEMISLSGNRIYIDAFYDLLEFACESEGFGSHAEKITRDRFSFEKVRARTIAYYGYHLIPFSRDELDKNSEFCKRNFNELLGSYSSSPGSRAMELLTVYEREVLRYALRLHRPLRLADVKYCLQLGYASSHRTLNSLVDKKLIQPIGTGLNVFMNMCCYH